MSERRLTVMRSHFAADCPDRENCWAADIHDEYEALSAAATRRVRTDTQRTDTKQETP